MKKKINRLNLRQARSHVVILKNIFKKIRTPMRIERWSDGDDDDSVVRRKYDDV